MTSNEIAEKWSKLFVLKVFDDEQRIVFTREAFETEEYEILSDIIHNVDAYEDFAYEQVQNALEAIAESGLEDVREHLSECITPDVYTNHLTAWLARSIHHVSYLTEAIESGAENGFAALIWAQELAIEEIWQAVIEAIQNEVNESDSMA